ncbi:mitotic checkpoint protein BUB3-like protein [Cokeromyces recurvatus]|uniref:mitotic checkpoint protein BUB3-like protein n=1 Tax=Cokeromyces recurvatus TaxID=90255 RepID=UPI002221208A|nr:mitotic checkpoint protein BUB3-like protein [Cokeromyces recurvatus]KAI7901660.1 mitotic checkpoint protein BUB3-like protein [Cokeromyces recurvatus]
MKDPTQIELRDPPRDGITNICFHPEDPNILLASSWDKTLRVYNIEQNELIKVFNTDSVILDCCFGSNDTVYFGGLDKKVKMIDLNTNTEKVIGTHDEAVSCVCWGKLTNKIYTGSWDKTLRIWDPSKLTEEKIFKLEHKVYSMDVQNDKLAIAMSDRKTLIYNILDMSSVWQSRETTLRYMLKCVRLMPNGEGYACSSIEGRVAIEYFDMTPEIQSKKYAFKSHRQTINDNEVVYPVNALAFHPKYGTFASGGSDCVVCIWDGVHRKRLKMFPGYPEEIAKLAFSPDGKKLAIASSYVYDEGERDHAPDTIFIKTIEDSDVAPRNIQRT